MTGSGAGPCTALVVDKLMTGNDAKLKRVTVSEVGTFAETSCTVPNAGRTAL